MANSRSYVAKGATHRNWINIGCVHLNSFQNRSQSGAHRTRATAQINYNRSWTSKISGLANEKLSAAAGNEDSWIHYDLKSAELRPADDMFKRKTSCSPVNHGGEFSWGLCCADEQPGLIFGENTTRVPKLGGNIHKFPSFPFSKSLVL
jgi:hypothetical protein